MVSYHHRLITWKDLILFVLHFWAQPLSLKAVASMGKSNREVNPEIIGYLQLGHGKEDLLKPAVVSYMTIKT